MVAGTLAGSGYYMGDDLISASPSNPKGFFEDLEINMINEKLLDPVVPKRPRFLGRWLFRDRPTGDGKWLSQIPVGVHFSCPQEIAERIQSAVSRTPYCFKDPRFSYTLPAWKPFLQNTVFVCVFRHPAATARSIVKESRSPKWARKVSLNLKHALNVWTIMYRHILECHRHEGEWLFLHYDQVLSVEGLDRLESFLHAKVDRTFPDSNLRHDTPAEITSRKAMGLYQELCALARFENSL